MDYSTGFVVLFGVGTVFVGLVCIIILTRLISFFCNLSEKPREKQNVAVSPESGTDKTDGKIAAVLTAAAASYAGVDVSQIEEIRIRRVEK